MAKKKTTKKTTQKKKDIQKQECTPDEKRRIDKFYERYNKGKPLKFKTFKNKNGKWSLDFRDPNDNLQSVKFMEATGTVDNNLQAFLLEQVFGVFKEATSENRQKIESISNSALALLNGIQPQDELEGMLAAQMIGVHNMAMDCVGRATRTDIWIERDLLKSKAYHALKKPSSYKVLAIFWTKRQFAELKLSDKKQWNMINNGHIVFTFVEAKKDCGISGGAFRDAIDELREKGFIDIAATGQGVFKVTNLYHISNRWRKYDTDEYEPPKPRKKGPINRGFQKGNKLGRNCKKTNC